MKIANQVNTTKTISLFTKGQGILKAIKAMYTITDMTSDFLLV